MSYSSRVYRQRNPQPKDEKKQKPFFSSKYDDGRGRSSKKGAIQSKLAVNEPGDTYEREADNVANKVVNDQASQPAVQKQRISTLQRLATPAEEEKLGTNDARMKRDKDIQEKPLQRADPGKDKEKVQKKDEVKKEEEKVQKKGDVKKEEDKVQKKDDSKKEEEKVQKKGDVKKEEDKVQKKDDSKKEEEKVQKKDDVKKEEEKIQKKDESKKEEDKVQKMDDVKKEEEKVQQKEERKEEEKPAAIQAKSTAEAGTVTKGVSSRIEKSSGKGESLPAKTLHEMNTGFGLDFSKVNIHDNEEAAGLSQDLEAQAFTHENDIYFNKGKFDPGSAAGKFLLAHELTHVAQQKPDMVSRKKVGSKFTHSTGTKSPFKKMTATFDGKNFSLFGDSVKLMESSAGSGRPYSVKKKHAIACGGSTSDSYLNNPLYVGMKDDGPIPEGTYKFRVSELATFTPAEEKEILFGGNFHDPFDKPMHGGDWGAGRVALHKVSIKKARKGCGDTAARSGFYLHGGIAPGSSGCIDIGDAGISSLLKHLDGYKGEVVVKVNYLFPPPVVDASTRALGRFMYPGMENPSMSDRMEAMMRNDSE